MKFYRANYMIYSINKCHDKTRGTVIDVGDMSTKCNVWILFES